MKILTKGNKQNFVQDLGWNWKFNLKTKLNVVKCSFFVYVLLNTQLTIKLLYGRHLYVHFHLITEVLLR
jgi:hypothetical protein